ncbi:alpha/beta hydrolase [Pikeienuella piscinae]|uniref:Alpha/beta hydrolase n=1 Tax=Pikeienuella piscinae TaxID=2748098 RepID=A0A7M3T564_9RHOB|nr:alpha/beta hydrolase [Pikeienuella piscinae]QIE57145.1 alpha/beta hydrolase [Pikeienuella piscinae]
MKRFRTADGLQLAYRDEPGGPGAPLLCLAGLTRSGRDFDHFATAMKARRRLIRLDCRGRGASDFDPDFSHYNAMVEAGDALALLDHLDVERAVVVGSSRGGILAAMIATTRPERLAGIVLNDVGPVIEADGIAKIIGYLGIPPEAKTMTEAAAGLKALFGAAFTDVDAGFWSDWAERSYVVTAEGLTLAYDPKLRDATLAQVAAAGPEGGDLWPLFAALKPIPTLALRGANSDLLSAATLVEMAAQIPALITAEIPGRGHIPRLDEPAALEAINGFLDGLDD